MLAIYRHVHPTLELILLIFSILASNLKEALELLITRGHFVVGKNIYVSARKEAHTYP